MEEAIDLNDEMQMISTDHLLQYITTQEPSLIRLRDTYYNDLVELSTEEHQLVQEIINNNTLVFPAHVNESMFSTPMFGASSITKHSNMILIMMHFL